MARRAMVEVENVNAPGRVSNVDAEKYWAMREALLAALPDVPPGLRQAEMGVAVVPRLPQHLWPNGSKAMWWVKTVQLDLEAKGLVARDVEGGATRWRRS